MKVFLGFVFLLGVTALSLAISRLSNDAVALASGVVLGVVGGLPVAVIIALLVFRDRPAQPPPAAPAQFQPPVVVIYPPAAPAPAARGWSDMERHLLELENEQLRYAERGRMLAGYGDSQPRRVAEPQEQRRFAIRPIESSYDVDGEVW